jgi:hypothetical protein
MAISPEDDEVVLACEDGKLRVYDVASLTQKARWAHGEGAENQGLMSCAQAAVDMNGPVFATAFSPTGKFFVGSDKSTSQLARWARRVCVRVCVRLSLCFRHLSQIQLLTASATQCCRRFLPG